MASCWICKEEVDEHNASGKRGKTALVGICKPCNIVYSLVRSLVKLTDKELKERSDKSARRLIAHQVVSEFKGKMKVGEMSKEILRRMSDVL